MIRTREGIKNLNQFSELGLSPSSRDKVVVEGAAHLPSSHDLNLLASIDAANFVGLIEYVSPRFFGKPSIRESFKCIVEDMLLLDPRPLEDRGSDLSKMTVLDLASSIPLLKSVVIKPYGVFPTKDTSDEELEGLGLTPSEKLDEGNIYNILRKNPAILVTVDAEVSGLKGQDFYMRAEGLPFQDVINASNGLRHFQTAQSFDMPVLDTKVWQEHLGDNWGHYVEQSVREQINRKLSR